jgi:hypothetical protein
MINKLKIEIDKMCSRYKILFLENNDVADKLKELEDELLFMLSSCLKYKTGRIEIKGEVNIDNKNFDVEYNDYTAKGRQGWHSFFVTRDPGLRHCSSHNHSDFDLFSNDTLFMNGDVYSMADDDKKVYLSREVHFNRLVDLSKETKYCKINKECLVEFRFWLRKTMQFKNEMLKYYNCSYSYSPSAGNYAPRMILSNVINELNVELKFESLGKIENYLKVIALEKENTIKKCNHYLHCMKKINKNFRIILKLKEK